jgi:uncharacterized membrane protein YsdA (DUF1294 family)
MHSDNYFFAYLTVPNILAAIAAVNVWTFMLFGLDKIRAEEGSWRISESTLLVWAFYGGTMGAYAGRAIFRHKTRKQPFSSRLHGIAIFQLFAGAGAGGWFLL